ncbi:TonB-dependent receptor [Seongchinamella sediminis]|uniref:TonB-dependent receptor n=1 Tax=Seongchinamella sediminis TaxID=2283635 RepID=A0A3L7E1F4_9GAMM|nr:TonB-dependent receptor [Seongchinamella sediminis]RLQ22163.1 TonB-dependent receptor [Seongchinamella sediminis]
MSIGTAKDPEARPVAPPAWRGAVLAAALGLGLASTAGATAGNPIHYAIEAPQLSAALIQLSQQSGVSIVFADRVVRDLPAPEVVGTVTTSEALDTLLLGTDLGWKLVDSKVIAIFQLDCANGCLSAEEVISKYPAYVPGIEETYVYGTRVTGSRIRRSGHSSGAPVDIISAPDIELSGAQTLGELLKFVPAVSGNALSTAISNGGNGTATVTLRGLPASNTLVLINGRRVANDGLAGESVDLNSIPPAAVERIEILKDGASAIYGSDAIAGVVNVITKRDFHGLLGGVYYGQSQEGDLETTTQTLKYGTGLVDGSFFFTASHYQQDPIYSRNRAVSRSADSRSLGGTDQRSSATPDARISLPTGQTLIAQGDGYRPAGAEDLFNYQAFTTAVVPLERDSIYTNASYDFSERVTGYVELNYVATEAESTLAPTPVFTAFEQTELVVAADNIYNSLGQDLQDVRRRLVEFPDRRQRNESETTRFSAVLEGLFDAWNWDFAYNWSRSEATETTTGIVNADRLARAIGPAANCRGAEEDGCVPVNLTGPAGSISPEQVDYIITRGEVSGYSKLASGSFNVSRAFNWLSAGRTDIAAGLEYRRESTSKQPSSLLANAATIGATNFEATRGSRSVTELYLETVLPLWKSASGLSSFDLEAAIRYSDYSDFGGTNNPKIALRWRPSPSWLIRANYAEGFRAPSLNELYEGTTEEQAFINDPCTQAANVGRLPGCRQRADATRNQFLTLKGGNAELSPETSDSYSLGVVWTPAAAKGLALSIDLFEIRQQNVVSSSAQFIVSQNARAGAFADRVERDAMGNLTLVSASNINIGEREVSGADFGLTWHLPRLRWGQFSVVSNASWINEYLARLDLNAPSLDLAGTFRDQASEGLGGIPEWKAQLGLRWSRERWKASYQLHYIGEMTELIPESSRTRAIDDWLVHDIQLNYTFPVQDGLRLTLGIDNLWDEEAPLATSAFNDNIDGRSHELKGRFWYTKLSLRL